MIGSHSARYLGGGDVLKKNAHEARSVTISDASPASGWGPSARSMPVNFVSAKKVWTCLATEVPLMWPPIIVAIRGCCGCPSL